MKISIYELLGMVKDESDRSIYVKYFDRVNKKEDVMWACKENIIYKLNQLIIELNDEVEILRVKRTYEEWLKYYENATKEQVIEDTMYDMEEIDRLNNIINELGRWCNDCIDYHIIARENGDTTISDTFFEIVLDKLKELKENK